MPRSLPRILVLLIAAAGTAGAIAVRPKLPARMASHFDGAGNPDGWSTPGSFYAICAAMLALVFFFAFGVPVLVRLLPVSLINLPNREYWLEASRREETLKRLEGFMAEFACGMAVFLTVVMGLVVHANLSRGGRMSAPGMWIALGGFVAFVVGWLVRLYAGFRVPKA